MLIPARSEQVTQLRDELRLLKEGGRALGVQQDAKLDMITRGIDRLELGLSKSRPNSYWPSGGNSSEGTERSSAFSFTDPTADECKGKVGRGGLVDEPPSEGEPGLFTPLLEQLIASLRKSHSARVEMKVEQKILESLSFFMPANSLRSSGRGSRTHF
jgi:hypothetical protein